MKNNLRNRDKKKLWFSRSFWCRCDFSLISPYEKCPICGSKRKNKKSKPSERFSLIKANKEFDDYEAEK